MWSSRRPTLLLVLALLAVAPLLHNMQRAAEAYRPRLDVADRILYLPDGDHLAPACLGYDGMVGDLIWVRAILFFGAHHEADTDDRWTIWLYYMLDLVTDLDPRFIPAYKYGGLMLGLRPGWTQACNLLMAKGMASNPDEWYLPFAIAMNYFEEGEVERAAEFARRAAAQPDAPFYLPNLAATMLNDSSQEEAALRFLQVRYETALDDEQRGVIYVKIQETKFEIAARDLQAARDRFREDHGVEAVELEQLVPRYVPAIPDDPYAVFVEDPGRCGLRIDPLDRSVTSACLQEALLAIRERYGVGSVP